MSVHKQCPCGANINYQNCCEKFIKGKELPETPEELMRSRYTAYTKANISYIANTMCGKSAEKLNAGEAKAWAQTVNWLGLEIINAPEPILNRGFVEFIARYYYDHKVRQMHEKSEFNLINGKWFYVNGMHL